MRKDPRKQNMTVDEYLKFEERSQIRHEYVDGQIHAMTGATAGHVLLCKNFVSAFDRHLDGSPCRVEFTDIKVHVKAANCFYYPDVLITCEPFDPKA